MITILVPYSYAGHNEYTVYHYDTYLARREHSESISSALHHIDVLFELEEILDNIIEIKVP